MGGFAGGLYGLRLSCSGAAKVLLPHDLLLSSQKSVPLCSSQACLLRFPFVHAVGTDGFPPKRSSAQHRLIDSQIGPFNTLAM